MRTLQGIALLCLSLLLLSACLGTEDDGSASSSSGGATGSVPATPTGLTATVDGTRVDLSWSAVDQATSYQVYRGSSLLVATAANYFFESDLAAGTYSYSVAAVNSAGASAQASISATIAETAPAQAPAAPSNLIAIVDGFSVALSWDAVSSASSYQVYRDSRELQSVSANAFSESGLGVGSYAYAVSAVNSVGASAQSALAVTIVEQLVAEDPLQPYQWHLENTGQSAFSGNTGSVDADIRHSAALAQGWSGEGVRVNVIDTGLELQHPDLQANIIAGGSYDYLEDDDDPTNNTATGGDHGTSVAGLIAAGGDNAIGVSGVAPSALLQGYNYLSASPQTVSGYVLAHGLDAKLEATAIFNKSLGAIYTQDARLDQTLLDTLSCLTSGGAFDSATTCTGALRSGLGAIYVKAAANEFNSDSGDALCDSLGLSCWQGNMEPEQTYPYQIVVGALNAQGSKSSYSSSGASLWLAAPGGEYGWDYEYLDSGLQSYGYQISGVTPSDAIWHPAMLTLDQVGCDRGYTTTTYNFGIFGVPPLGVTSFHEDDELNANCEYTSTFNGTSSATPVVSGVVALMLEANPDLSWRDVKHILAHSARPVDSEIAVLDVAAQLCINSDCSANSRGETHEESTSILFSARDAWRSNAAGYSFHNWYGFGALDAGAAVELAETYDLNMLGAWSKVSSSSGAATSIPDATGLAASIDITITSELSVEAAQLDLTINHGHIADLAVVLISPAGTRSVLLTPFNIYEGSDFDSTLLSNAFYGEEAGGTWQLQVYDLREGNSGTITRAQLNIYGH